MGLLLPLACAGIGIVAALRVPLMDAYARRTERNQDDSGWLPAAPDVTAIRVRVRELNSDGEIAWRDLQVPDSTIPKLLSCLEQRTDCYPNPHRSLLVTYDMRAQILIELTVARRRRPVRIGLVSSKQARVGTRLMNIPPADADRLGALVNDLQLSEPPPAPASNPPDE